MTQEANLRPTSPLAVIDTNVVLDWLVFRDPRVDALVAAIRTGRVGWISCPTIRRELAHMVAHRQLSAWSPDADATLAEHDRHARLQSDPPPLAEPRPRCSDADDQVFVDLALTHRAAWLFTHDRALLRLARRLKRWQIDVRTPMAWSAPE
jgi:predicted nucleic acid-binding protein